MDIPITEPVPAVRPEIPNLTGPSRARLEDARANDLALRQGGTLDSSYRAADGTKFSIVTEADRSVTTILLPDDR